MAQVCPQELNEEWDGKVMNVAPTIEEVALIFQNERPEGALAFLASRSRKSARQLSAPASEVFKGITEAVDQLLLSAIEARTNAEFRKAFEASFPKYAAITIALSSFAHAMVPAELVNRMARESICELEAEFREKALAAFGAAVKDQLLFTVWTLRKINDLLAQISAIKPDVSKEEDDKTYCQKFVVYTLRAHFSLDCLNMALHLNRPIYPEVMEGLKDGLRSMVNAYAWARRGAALRIPSAELILESDVSDEEENELLHSSMQDMALMLDAEESQ